MKFKKILTIGLNANNLEERCWREIKALADKIVSVESDSKDIEKELKDTDAVLTGFGVEIGKKYIDFAPSLKYIGIMATAFGKVDVAYAAKKGISVCNLAGYSTESVAEWTMAAILESIRGLEEGKTRARTGNYSEVGIKAREIKAGIFAVLGLGSIGGRVAEIAQGFGADVRYWSRSKKTSFENKGIKYQELDALLEEADFISINLPESKETTGILNAKRFRLLKSGGVVINTAPMELVDLEALKTRLAKGDITFIFDHSDQMKPEDVESLVTFKNCIAYPPIAYITDEAKANKQKILIENIQNYLRGKPTNKVN